VLDKDKELSAEAESPLTKIDAGGAA